MAALSTAVEAMTLPRAKQWRLRVTSACNAKCIFCHGEGHGPLGQDRFVSPGTLKSVLSCYGALGDSIAITGGEPLLHPNLHEIIGIATKFDPECHLNTNGLLLGERLSHLISSGLRSVHVNLSTINPALYSNIYGVRLLRNMPDNLIRVLDAGLSVTINCVLLPGINDTIDEVLSMTKFTQEHGFSLAIIEPHEPKRRSDGKFFQARYKELLESMGYLAIGELPGRIKYIKGSSLVSVTAPCAPAQAWNGCVENDAYIILENGAVTRFSDGGSSHAKT